MKRMLATVAVLLTVAACAHVDPMKGHSASDLPPGPLQPLPSDSAPATPDCDVLAPSRGATSSKSDADFLEIVFTNKTNSPCTAHGYPTLTMRSGSGQVVGENATLRANGAARYLVLKPGESATATVRFPKDVKNCQSGTSKIEILIPGATERVFIPETHPYCPGWTVTAIHVGSA